MERDSLGVWFVSLFCLGFLAKVVLMWFRVVLAALGGDPLWYRNSVP